MIKISRLAATLAAFLVAPWALAMDPPEGTMDENNTFLSSTGGPYAATNTTGLAGDPVCTPTTCDEYLLNIGFDAGFVSANPNFEIRFEIGWDMAADDIDVYFYDDQGNELGTAATSANPEAFQVKLSQVTSSIRVVLVLFATAGSNATLTAELLQPQAGEEIDPCAPTGEANGGQAQVDPEVLADFERLGPNGIYGAFVHFNDRNDKRNDALLEGLGLSMLKDFRKYSRAVFVEGPVSALQSLVTEPMVGYIEYNRPMRYLGGTQSWASRARVAHEPVSGGPYRDANGQVIDGTGVTLGIIDSGLYGLHPDFADNLLHNFKVVNISGVGPSYVDIGHQDSESQVGGHGTHVTGTVAGRGQASQISYPVPEAAPYIQGTYTGAAPGAQIVHWGNGAGLLVLSVTTAYEHMLENMDSFDPPLVAVNNSYGSDPGPYNPASAASCLIKEIVDRGVVMAFAASNDGGNGTVAMTSPACRDTTPGVICVASYNDLGTGDRDAPISGFSSRGEIGKTETYPDIAAPGDLITSTCFQSQASQAICTGGDNEVGADQDWFPWYGTISGTSMASPHITGIIGLMKQARPELTPAEIENIILDTARKVGGPGNYEADPQNPDGTTNFEYGAGLVDVPAILDALGVGKAGLPAKGAEWTVADGDADGSGGADDIVKLTMQDDNVDGLSGIRYRLTVADGAGLGSDEIRFRVENKVAGQAYETSVVSSASGMSIPDAGAGNDAVATEVSAEGNVVSFFVPYLSMGAPAINEPVHNIRAFALDATGVTDVIPSPAGDTDEKKPSFGRPFTIQQVAGVLPPSNEKSCVLPGFTMHTSPAGNTGNAAGTGHDDMRHIWLAEPSELPGKVVFTMKVDNLDPSPQPSHRWYVYFSLPDDPTNYWVAMTTDTGVPAFTYGTRDVVDGPVGVGVYETLGNLAAESSWTTDGVITMVMDKATLGLETGTTLSAIVTSIRQTTNTSNGAGLTVDTAGGGSYTLVGNDVCLSPDGPVATPSQAGPDDPGRFGGALGLALLGAMFGGACLRRRRSA